MGTEKGPCYPNKTCNKGLECWNGMCVKPAPDAGRDAARDTSKPLDGPATDAPAADKAILDKALPDKTLPDKLQPDISTVPPTWSAMPVLTKESLRSVWGSAAGDVFVVGLTGTILHFDGTKPLGFPWWSAMTAKTSQHLTGVWGSAPFDVFAVGNKGVVLHYDGVTWSSGSSGHNQSLTGVWSSGPTDVFAVGHNVQLLHNDRKKTPYFWAKMSVAKPPPTMRDVWGLAKNAVYAVGDGGTILLYDGKSWKQMISNTTTMLLGVWAAGSGSVFAVGDKGAIMMYDGTAWKQMMSNTSEVLRGVWGTGPSNVYVVGNKGIILRFDGTSWSKMTSGTTEDLLVVWGAGPGNVFAVGNQGTILQLGSCHCVVGKTCYAAGDRDSTGCKVCDPAKSSTSLSPYAGDCKVAGKCYKKGQTDTTRCKVCDPKTSTTALTTVAGTCQIGGYCYPKGSLSEVSCKLCDLGQSKVAWSLGAGKCLIGGECFKKGDKDDTNCSACDPSTDKLTWTPISGLCKIDGACYVKGAKHSQGCAECDPKTSAAAWTVKGSTHCLISDNCETSGTPDASKCKSCIPSKSKYAYTATPGICTIGGKCIQKGVKHPQGCAECDAAVNATHWTVKGTTHCLIGGKCETAGVKEPTGCSACTPAKNKYDWTLLTGVCTIGNKCYSKGDKHGKGCAECDPASSTTQWTAKGTTECFIDNNCFPAGTKNPHPGSCDSCQPTKDNDAYYPDAGSCKIDGQCMKDGTKHAQGCATCASNKDQVKWTPNSAKVCVQDGKCRTMCGTSCVDLTTSASHCSACNKKCPAGQYCVASKCGKATPSCAHIKISDPTAKSGNYTLITGGTTIVSYCDMTTDKGGWTMVQRTVWDWSKSKALMTNYSDFYNKTVGSLNSAWRAAGQRWPSWNGKKEMLVALYPRRMDGTSCAPLFHKGVNGTLVADTAKKEFKLNGLVSQQLVLTQHEFLSTKDSGPSSTKCVNTPQGVPWFYGNCCDLCPTMKGNYFNDAPHPMAKQLTVKKDMFGKVTSDVCGGKPVYTTSNFVALNKMEVYLR